MGVNTAPMSAITQTHAIHAAPLPARPNFGVSDAEQNRAVARRIPLIKSKASIPVGVGFGVRDAATAKALAAIADAVVIGSRIIQEMEDSKAGEEIENVKTFMTGIRAAMDEVAVA